MRRGKHRKFGRESIQRQALLKALATALIMHGKIKTTKAKAKTLKQFADKLVTRARKGDVQARRLLARQIGVAAVKKLTDEIAPKFRERAGGYTRVIPLPRRRSDGSEMAVVEFVS